MKVSVAMITYNQASYIEEAVTSAVEQDTDFDFEVVVGDDCSVDGTQNILLDLQRRWPHRVRLLPSERNLGPNRNLVRVIQACRGDYVGLLEGDDYWSCGSKLRRQVEFLDSHAECSMCYHDAAMYLQDSGAYEGSVCGSAQPVVSCLDDLLSGRIIIPTCSVMFRHHLIPEFPDWYFRLYQGDWTLHVLNACHGKIGYLDRVMGVYRVHREGAWSLQSPSRNLRCMIEARETVKRHFCGKFDTALNRVIFRCYYELASVYAQEGEWKSAKSCLARCLMDMRYRGSIPVVAIFSSLLRVWSPTGHEYGQMAREVGRQLALRFGRTCAKEVGQTPD